MHPLFMFSIMDTKIVKNSALHDVFVVMYMPSPGFCFMNYEMVCNWLLTNNYFDKTINMHAMNLLPIGMYW